MKLSQIALIGATGAALALCTPLHALYLADAVLEPEAICSTDEDCARYCPPPADEPECDGGPDDEFAGQP